ncbi:hypothetical protein C0991_011792 [Blastosporella zonata]|nr:hypothetical protein C0991_011792 [Blastosporella zonata]
MPPPISLPDTANTNEMLSPAFVDAVANELGFGDEDQDYRNHLHGFFQMGAGLSKPDLATRVYLLASHYKMMKTLVLSAQNTQRMHTLFNDIYLRLEDNFSLTKDQETALRIIVQDQIFKPSCISFHLLASNVESPKKFLKINQEDLQLAHIFKHPTRERVLLIAVKTQCRITKNAFREMLRDSVLGDNTITLNDMCWTASARFRRGGHGTGTSQIERARLSILRRFTFDNQHLVNFAVPIDDVERTSSSSSTRPSTPGPNSSRSSAGTPNPDNAHSRPSTPIGDQPSLRPPSKRKRVDGYTGGRPQKGQDYCWSSEAWERYIAATIEWDISHFTAEEEVPAFMRGSPHLPAGDLAPQIGSAPLTGPRSGNANPMAGIFAAM